MSADQAATSVSQVSGDPWRLACPEGHRSLCIHSEGWRCRYCEQVYRRAVDMKTGRRVRPGGTAE